MGKQTSLPIKEVSNTDIGLSLIMNQKLPITPSWRFGQWKENSEKIMKPANKKREELIKDLGFTKPDGSVEVLPENKHKYFEAFKLLMDEKVSIDIPEIQTSLLKDVPMTARFTALIGQYLVNDAAKYKTEKFEDLTNQQMLDLDLAISLVMNELMTMPLAMKLGDVKRKAEATSIELKDLREGLFKKHGHLNDEFDYVVTDPAKRKIIDDAVTAWLEEKAKPVDLPTFQINEFETHIMIGEEKRELQFPLRFFTLFSPLIKNPDDEKKNQSKKTK